MPLGLRSPGVRQVTFTAGLFPLAAPWHVDAWVKGLSASEHQTCAPIRTTRLFDIGPPRHCDIPPSSALPPS